MGYINVTRNIGGGGSSTYISEKVKIKETVEAPDMYIISDVNKYSSYSSSYNINISDNAVVTGFSSYTYAYINESVFSADVADGYIFECSFPTPSASKFSTIWKKEGITGVEYNNQQVIFYNYADGTSSPWSLDNNVNKHYIRCIYTPSGVSQQYYSTDGETYTLKGTFNNSPGITLDGSNLIIGNHDGIMSRYFQAYSGLASELDLKDWKIKNYTTGDIIWEVKHQLYHKYYDNTEEGDN